MREQNGKTSKEINPTNHHKTIYDLNKSINDG